MSRAPFRLRRWPPVKAHHLLVLLVTLAFYVDGRGSETLPATDPRSIESLTVAVLRPQGQSDRSSDADRAGRDLRDGSTGAAAPTLAPGAISG